MDDSSTLSEQLKTNAPLAMSVPSQTQYLLSKLQTLWKNKDTCDVSFFVGSEKKEIKAHAALVAVHSPVLNALLFGPLKEANKKRVDINDCSYEDFSAFLEYLYTGVIKLTG